MNNLLKCLHISLLLSLASCATKPGQEKELNSLILDSDKPNQFPSITKPKIRSYVVPDSVEGNKFIKAHRVFVLEDPGSWSKD